MQTDQLLTRSLQTHPLGHQLSEIMTAALAAVDPAQAVRHFLRTDGDDIVINNRRYSQIDRIIVLGAGKAGAPMAQATYAQLGHRISAGLVVVKEGHLAPVDADLGPIALHEAGHPIPDQRAIDAAAQMRSLLHGLTERDLVLVLLSGGGSALLTDPVAGLTLTDLQALTAALLRCGAHIGEINTLRKHCTRMTGGQMARFAAPAQVATLIVSDVVGSPLDVIASGPTTPDPTTFADAWRILENYEITSNLPSPLLDHLRRGLAGEIAETPKPGEALWGRVHNTVIASNALAAEAALVAAQQRGLNTLLLTTFLEGEAREVGKIAAALAREIKETGRPIAPPALLVAGGETTVTLRGEGKGGRNQELALGAVTGLSSAAGAVVIALATDGGDGPTEAAGAVATSETLARGRQRGLDPVDFLRHNDAYHYFAALEDLLLPGPTLTNVNDLLFVAVA